MISRLTCLCLSIHLSYICLSVYSFWMITWVKINGFSPNLVCAWILWGFGLGLLMGKFCQFLSELSACHISIFSFPDDNLSKCQWIFIKYGMCIDIVEILCGIAIRQISLIYDRVICPSYNNDAGIINLGFYFGNNIADEKSWIPLLNTWMMDYYCRCEILWFSSQKVYKNFFFFFSCGVHLGK